MATEILTDGSLFASNKLGMVNQCLLAIGETPLADGTVLNNLQQGTDGAIARDIVASTVIDVMSQGWFFNTDHNFRLYPDVDGFITVPANFLRIDSGATEPRGRYILRGNRAYDRADQTFKFNTFITATTVYSIAYEDMPQSAYRYMALRSARQFQETVVGSDALYRFTVNAEAEALANMQRENMQYEDFNMLSHRVATSYMNPIWGND